ncbi:TetR/AcrR family transcriptional regulator [Priestia filamentosa]|uniref:TetR family transcriptional regulator n=1 Tax=Priestia filamentosa TaxID=1402861 RepID=A0A1X7EKV5_9BACI|nr:TetR/AcrR family transcriptional regulator [Priestia filamentosa]AKO93089.1 TetR family transcriptional regulator [Priestia filamentosa]MDT3763214.1 TetR/AcrR family transcriptional regulator [Priestia filamentosa]OXS69722.1 TetR family transcriptional regulator [Priestia filamentosa]RJS63617.1 TetR/AcrR family transcriptional regulator [Priestia filamentosa]WRU93688.1 TetR/AcrR family transcriptional regulator [Priestia filamentosa]
MTTKSEEKRALILKAATEWIVEHDFHNLTLEAVAKKAGISKGGLLYHFPSKEDLLVGLTQSIFEEFTLLLDEKAENDPIEKGRWSRAYIELSRWDLENNSKLNVAVMAQSLLNPEASKTMVKSYEYTQDRLLNDGLDPVIGAIIRLTIDGLYYSQLLDIAPIEKELKKETFEKLYEMTK